LERQYLHLFRKPGKELKLEGDRFQRSGLLAVGPGFGEEVLVQAVSRVEFQMLYVHRGQGQAAEPGAQLVWPAGMPAAAIFWVRSS